MEIADDLVAYAVGSIERATPVCTSPSRSPITSALSMDHSSSPLCRGRDHRSTTIYRTDAVVRDWRTTRSKKAEYDRDNILLIEIFSPLVEGGIPLFFFLSARKNDT